MRNYMVYKTTNIKDGKYYIGAHESETLTDRYLGSGTHLKRAIKMYGRECFVRVILEICSDRESMFISEMHHINLSLGDKNLYNMKPGGNGGWDSVNASDMNRGNNNRMKNPDVVKRCVDAGNKTRALNPSFYKKIANENLQKAIKSNIGKKKPNHAKIVKEQSKKRWKTNRERMLDALNSLYEITTVDGEIITTNRLNIYCKDRGLPYVSLWKSAKTNRLISRGRCKGWTCQKII